MTTNQLAFAKQVEDIRHNQRVENETERHNRAAIFEQYRSNIQSEGIKKSANAINEVHFKRADSASLSTAQANRQNADSNRRNASTNRMNADTNVYSATTQRVNSDTNRINAMTNQVNAETNIRNVEATESRNYWQAILNQAQANLAEEKARTEKSSRFKNYLGTVFQGVNSTSSAINATSK